MGRMFNRPEEFENPPQKPKKIIRIVDADDLLRFSREQVEFDKNSHILTGLLMKYCNILQLEIDKIEKRGCDWCAKSKRKS